MKKVLKLIIRKIATSLIKKYDPYIIAITGSVGKTSTKDAIYSVLSEKFNVWASAGNLNNELGAPLVFFKQKKAPEGPFEWLATILRGLSFIIFSDDNYASIVIVEMGADKPGDIKYLSEIIPPKMAVVTAVGEVPVHIEFYKNAEEVAKEKENIVLKSKELAVLSFDDPLVRDMKKDKKIYFGFKEGADVRVKNFQISSFCSSFDIEYKGKSFPFTLNGLGKPCAYAFSAAFAVALSFLPPEEISASGIKIPPGRNSVIKGIKESTIIDGSYNSSPLSMISSLEMLENVTGKRKIAVIGDMLELGELSFLAHENIAEKAAEFCDYLFFVGKFSKDMKGVVAKKGFRNVFSFPGSCDAITPLKEIISSEDVILVKGSQGVRLEKLVEKIMENPSEAKNVLVRQSAGWKKK